MIIGLSNIKQRNVCKIKLPMSDKDLFFWMKGMKTSDMSERYVVESIPDFFFAGLTEKEVRIDELNFLLKRWESLTENEKLKKITYAEVYRMSDVKDLINLTYADLGLTLIQDFTKMESVGRTMYLDVYGWIAESEEIDFIDFAERHIESAEVRVTPHGVIFMNEFTIPEVYRGTTLPEYYHDADTVLGIALQNTKGEEDYLYLPTDIYSMNQMKQRLSVQEFSECNIARIENLKLPDDIFQKVKDFKTIEDLNHLNEMCEMVKNMNEKEWEQLAMVVDYSGADKATSITGVAKHLFAFEILPDIHTDEAYGEYLVEKSGLINADEVLYPHIDYRGFGKSKREYTLVESGFVEQGFVGSGIGVAEMVNYSGEFCIPLEINKSEMQTLRLYSPLSAILRDEHMEYDDGEGISGEELIYYEEDIRKAIRNDFISYKTVRGIMDFFDEDIGVAGKVVDAYPMVDSYEEVLYGVLECRIKEPLTDKEINYLQCYWDGQMSDGWGEGFEQLDIEVEDGTLQVSFWQSSNDYFIKTEEELKGNAQQEVKGMIMGL